MVLKMCPLLLWVRLPKISSEPCTWWHECESSKEGFRFSLSLLIGSESNETLMGFDISWRNIFASTFWVFQNCVHTKKAVGVGRTSNSSLRASTRLLLESSISARTQFHAKVLVILPVADGLCMTCVLVIGAEDTLLRGSRFWAFAFFAFSLLLPHQPNEKRRPGVHSVRTTVLLPPSTTACDAPALLKNCTNSKCAA